MKPFSFLITISVSGFIFMSAGFVLGAGIVEKHSLVRVVVRIARAGRHLSLALNHDATDGPRTADSFSESNPQHLPK